MTQLIDYKFIEHLKRLPYVEAIYLFGSRATGKNSQFSDIDLAISCPNVTSKDWQAVLDILENADTLLKIDCIRYDTLTKNSHLKVEIEKNKKILYEKSGTTNTK